MSNEYKEWEEELKNSPECSEDFNRWIIMEYPFMALKDKDGEYITKYTWFDDFPYGWKKAFGLQMLEEIKQTLIKENIAFEDYEIAQIKEKFGGLRWYADPWTNALNEVINKYEDLSFKTCINCGKPAEFISTGWICPYCSDCAHKSYNNISKKDSEIEPFDYYYKEMKK